MTEEQRIIIGLIVLIRAWMNGPLMKELAGIEFLKDPPQLTAALEHLKAQGIRL